MNCKRQITFLLAIFIAILMPAGSLLAQETAQVRFIYDWPGGPPIDVYVNDQLAAANLMPGDESPYFDVMAGDLDISSTIASTNVPAFPRQSLSAGAGDAVSIVMPATTADTEGTDETAAAADEAAIAAAAAAIGADETAFPTARVTNLNPGANLHLRRYPSAQAMSLGLVPVGTELAVTGREGTAVDDPAVGLARHEDLEPTDTWLHVRYTTPDGGLITAWANALYLQVLDESGEAQRLASLGMVHGEQFGIAINTSIIPPEPARRVTARVYSLDPGVQLNIRTDNHINSEIVGQARGAAVLSFLGLDEDAAWAFIEHRPNENTIITGWASIAYTELLLDGNLISVQDLMERHPALAPSISGETRGSLVVAGDGEAPPRPSPDPFLGVVVGEVRLDPGASLHLRLRPSVDERSLALIPTGTRLIVDGRTENGEWLRAAFDGERGWVSEQYLDLSFNSRYISDEELESRLDLFDNDGSRLSE